MKTLLLSLLLNNFNFSYQAPFGEGVSDTQKVKMEKIGDEFKVDVEGAHTQSYSFSQAPDFIQEALVIKLQAMNLNYDQSLKLSLGSGVFQSLGRDLSLTKVTLECEGAEELINGCLKKLSFKAANFRSQGEGFEQALMKAVDTGHDEFLGGLNVLNMDLKIVAGNFDLSADVKAQMSGKVKSTGTMSYEAGSKKITIKINAVKFGFLDVTSKVFEELKKKESEQLIINKPYIYILQK